MPLPGIGSMRKMHIQWKEALKEKSEHFVRPLSDTNEKISLTY